MITVTYLCRNKPDALLVQQRPAFSYIKQNGSNTILVDRGQVRHEKTGLRF